MTRSTAARLLGKQDSVALGSLAERGEITWTYDRVSWGRE